MTVPSQDPIDVSQGNGVAVLFPYSFRILAAGDLYVEVDGVPKVLGVDYTVDGVGVSSGGNVTFVTGAPADEATVVRQRRMQYKRDDDFQTGGELRAAEVNKNYDSAVMMIQQLSEAIGRALLLPPGLSGIGTLPQPDSLKGIRWNSGETGLENYEITGFSAPGGADLVGYVAAGSGAVGRTTQAKLREIEVSPADFGYFDGIADAGPSIQKAIDSLPARGGRVRLPSGLINFASPIVIGNGDGGGTPSTKNGVKLVGSGAAFAAPFSTLPTFLNYTGPATSAAAIQVRGQVSSCELSGFHLALNANAGGISLRSFSGCTVKGVKITNNRSSTNALAVLAGTAPTGNYNIYNEFSQISIGLFQPNSVGVFMDGDYASVNDTWLSKFELVRSEVAAGATNATCWWIKFADNITFTRCHIDNKPEPTANGLILDATDNPGFLNDYPSGLAFYDCSIAKIDVIEPGSSRIGPCYFYGHGANDLEVMPNHPRLFGINANGDTFGWNPGFRNRKNTDVNVQNTTVNTGVYSYSIGAYFLGGGDSFRAREGGVRVTHLANYINASGAPADLTIRVDLGGVLLFTIPFVAVPTGGSARSILLDFTLTLNNDVVTNEIGRVLGIMGAVGSAAGTAAAPFATVTGSNSSGGIAVNMANAQTLSISAQHSVASGAIAYTHKSTVLELL